MKFFSLYNNTQLTSNTKTIKIRVNREIPKLFSPSSNMRNNNQKNNNKIKFSTINRNKTKNTKNNNNILSSPNYLKDVNYIKYICINVDINKITQIQIWWKFMYKIIFLQKNIRSFIIKKKAKQRLKYINFISILHKIYFGSFFNNIRVCRIRLYFKKWKEIIDKRNIFNKLLHKKIAQNDKELLKRKKSYQNNVTKDNSKKRVNTSLFQDKIISPNRGDIATVKPMSIQINKKKTKNIPCGMHNSLNKSLNNKSLNNTNKRSKSNNRSKSRINNQSFHFDDKTQSITNNLYQNIKEYYNSNEINVNPKASTMNFYPKQFTKNRINNQKKLKKNIIIINNNSYKERKKTIISNKKYNNDNFNDFYKTNKIDNWNSYHHTFGNLKTNSIGNNNNNSISNNNKNNGNRIIQSTFLSPVCNSIRNTKRNKNRSLEFDDNDIISIKLLLKFKRAFIHWRNIIIKNKIIKKLRLISKIKNLIIIYKILYIKLFFAKIIQKINKNIFYYNNIHYNYLILTQYYSKLKEISKQKALINDINIKYNNKKEKVRDKIFKSKMNESKTEKKNNLDFKTESNTTNTGIYYATQFNQKFSELLNNKKTNNNNNNIIIINNNISNNCQQLINHSKENSKIKGNNNNNNAKKTVNNSMIDIQPTDTSLSCTVDLNNQSNKSLNSILVMNQMNIRHQNIISTKHKRYCLNKVFKIINNKERKRTLFNYINKWKMNIILKKCNKNKKIDEKIIHFPKSPTSTTNNNFLNINNYVYNYSNNSNCNIKTNHNSHYNYKNGDLLINTMFTDNNIKNEKINYMGNNVNSALLRNKMFSPTNKMSFYTQIQKNENNYKYAYESPRETEPKIVYHKKLFPSFGSSNYRHGNGNTIIIDYNYNNYNNEERNNISFNNNIKYNKISNFYSSNNFYSRRNNYHLEKINNILPEEKYGFKKINKIEEREISFSPTLSRKNYSFKNVINENNYQSINNNNININVVENYQNHNLNKEKRFNNYGNNYRPINRSMIDEDNFNKLMYHSHSQGFTKNIQNNF